MCVWGGLGGWWNNSRGLESFPRNLDMPLDTLEWDPVTLYLPYLSTVEHYPQTAPWHNVFLCPVLDEGHILFCRNKLQICSCACAAIGHAWVGLIAGMQLDSFLFTEDVLIKTSLWKWMRNKSYKMVSRGKESIITDSKISLLPSFIFYLLLSPPPCPVSSLLFLSLLCKEPATNPSRSRLILPLRDSYNKIMQ